MTLDLKCRPSEMLDIEDKYTAYCFDEAIAFIIKKLKDGEEPKFRMESAVVVKNYSKPSDLYKQFE